MSLFLLNGFKHYAGEAVARPSLAVGLTVVSVALAFVYSLLHDFAQAFLKRPEHFVRERVLDLIRKPKVHVPLVEPLDGGDYRELLARGSQMVCYVLCTWLVWQSNIHQSTQKPLIRSLTFLVRSLYFPTNTSRRSKVAQNPS
jgi:hypothetical protein